MFKFLYYNSYLLKFITQKKKEKLIYNIKNVKTSIVCSTKKIINIYYLININLNMI